MSAEALVLEQFLEIVWHSNQVELDLLIFEMNPRRVYISKDYSLVVDVADAETELSEDGDNLVEVKWPLTEGFPG